MDIQSAKEKFFSIQISKSWHYLAYLYLVLPGLLFGLGWLFKSADLGRTLAALFHNYGLFAVSTMPNITSFTGVIGLGLAGWFLFSAVRRQDWLDLGLSTALVALNTLYFYFGWNYQLLFMLHSL